MDATTFIEKFGLPLAILLALAVHHVRVVIRKDAEIARVNECRVKAAEANAERMLGVATEFTELSNDTRTSMALVAKHLSR